MLIQVAEGLKLAACAGACDVLVFVELIQDAVSPREAIFFGDRPQKSHRIGFVDDI